jgi:hypothetical protein
MPGSVHNDQPALDAELSADRRFRLPAEPPKAVSLDGAARQPALLKASFFGTERDVWFLERLAHNDRAIRLIDWLRELKLPAGQGYQVGPRCHPGT